MLTIEPSYYSWMMQGDFPLYTKRRLEVIYNRLNVKRQAERAAAKSAQTKPVETALKQADALPVKDFKNNNTPKNNYQQKPFKREDKVPVKPVDEDMLKLLTDKFKKG